MLKPGDTGYIINPWNFCKTTRTETSGGAPKCHNCGEPQRHPGHPGTRYCTVQRIYHQRYSGSTIKPIKVVGIGNGEYFCERQDLNDSERENEHWVDRWDMSSVYESREAAEEAAGPDEPIGEEHLNCGRSGW